MAEHHILIVDDEPKVGFFLRKSLELSQQNCQVSTARSGEKALEILERSTVDLLITDLRMPGISGLELIRWVKTSSPKTRTILITAYGSDEVRAEARRLEVYRYVTKPFNVRDFAGVVDQALKKMVMTRPGVTIFSDRAFEEITARLKELRTDVDAHCVYLADMQGQRLAEVGPTDGIDSTMLLTLLAGGFATAAELARQFNGGEAINLSFQEGKHYDIYSANVDESLIVAMLFDRSFQRSRVGMVWLYTRRAIDDLRPLFATLDDDTPSWEFEEDFGSTIMAELDTAFSDATSPSSQEEDPMDVLPESTRLGRGAEKSDAASVTQSSVPINDGVSAKPASAGGTAKTGLGAQSPVSDLESDDSESVDLRSIDRPGMDPQDDSLLSLEQAIDKGLLPPDFQNR